MPQIFQETKFPTVASTVPSVAGTSWTDPNNIKVADGNLAYIFLIANDTGSQLTGSSFGFKNLPSGAVIDGIEVLVRGVNFDGIGNVLINVPGAAGKPVDTLNITYGGPSDLWGLDSIDVSDIPGITATIALNSGPAGAGATVDYITITIYWHIGLEVPPADVPTTFAYKVYTSKGAYLGDLPNVISPFAFSQDINSAGSLLNTTCGVDPKPKTSVSSLLDDAGNPIQTSDSLDILVTSTYTPVVQGDSPDEALFKNGNRIKVIMFNNWYPNGKQMFSGQMNRVNFEIGGADQIQVTSYSDGMDMDNYVARGYPFIYTPDQDSSVTDGFGTVYTNPNGSYSAWGQYFTPGAGVENLGEITLALNGSARVTVTAYDSPNGNVLGSTSRQVIGASPSTPLSFSFPQLIPTVPLVKIYFEVTVDANESIQISTYSASDIYAGGKLWAVSYDENGDLSSILQDFGALWFMTASGEPTTTTTYYSDDPVTDMAQGILLDYNLRGGRITPRNLEATGLSLTYTFNSSTVLGAVQKALEMSPSGYYMFVDLGTSEIDILPTSPTPDYILTVGRDITKFAVSLTIERVKNQLLFSGGDVGGSNLFKLYQDRQSADNFDPRLSQRSDNRVTVEETADAIGTSFINVNSGEVQESTLALISKKVDHTLYVPGKTVGFRNSGTFLDEVTLLIVRRDFVKEMVTLTVGLLPIRQTSEIQRLNREMIEQQTVANPDQPQ